jgi:DNA-binding CsgD family transcriptional regulator
MSSTVIPSLTRWGLSADADLVYRALVLSGPAHAARLASDLGLTRPRVAAALDELAAAAATTSAGGRVWQPRAPGEVIGRIRRRPAGLPAPGDRWRRHFATIDGLGLRARDPVEVRHWPTRSAARRRAAELVAAERHEHLAVNNERVFSTESLSAAQPLDQSLLRRGILLRVLERDPHDGDRGVRPPGPAPSASGGLCRRLDDPPLKLMVFDRRVALFPADPLDVESGYVEVADARFVAAACTLFERLWTGARDPFRQGVAPIDLTSRESALVALLAHGHTDQTAAEQLGISPRTVAYAMRALMDRLGVENRFQLALVLGASGAVPVSGAGAPGRARATTEHRDEQEKQS